MNVIVQNITVEPVFRFGVGKMKYEHYAMSFESSSISDVNVLILYSALLS